MFGLNWLKSSVPAGRTQKEKAGIQFLASLLVCYPEIHAAHYEPKQETLTMDFLLKGDILQEKFEHFAKLLDESITTYHVLQDGLSIELSLSGESYGDSMAVLHIMRDVFSIKRGELTLMADLFLDFFDDRLVVDDHEPGTLAEDFLDMQSEILDQILSQVSELHLRSRMVGIREGDRVVVYDR